jgi:hypothetical protein
MRGDRPEGVDRRGGLEAGYGTDLSGNYDVGAFSGIAQLAEQPAVNR